MKNATSSLVSTALIALLSSLPCASAQSKSAASDSHPTLEQLEAPQPGSLYVRMGGAHTLQQVVDDLIDRAVRDPRTRRTFDKVDLARLKGSLAVMLCDLTGGGCKYSGDNMRDAHAGLGITEADFYGLVDDLRVSLRRHGVALRERNELLRILAPMKRDMVEK